MIFDPIDRIWIPGGGVSLLSTPRGFIYQIPSVALENDSLILKIPGFFLLEDGCMYIDVYIYIYTYMLHMCAYTCVCTHLSARSTSFSGPCGESTRRQIAAAAAKHGANRSFGAA